MKEAWCPQSSSGNTLELARAVYALAAAVARSMPRDMSPTSVAALSTLDRLGPLRLTRLAALQRVAQPSMTVVVSRLEAEGLVERRPDESDGRAVLLALTGEGRRYLQQRREARAAQLAISISKLAPEDWAALCRAAPAIARLAAVEEPGPAEAARAGGELAPAGRSRYGSR